MKLDKETEEKIKTEALKHLEKGKERWDVKHTLATVYWMRKLIEKEGGDERILVTAMYLHDIGYPELKGNYGYDQAFDAKKMHAIVGEQESEKILKRLNFSEEEISTIKYLIRKHDDLDDIDSKDRQMIMEADSLGQIDYERSPPSFNKENLIRFLEEHFKKKRVPLFKTETGKKLLKQLLEKFENYLAKGC